MQSNDIQKVITRKAVIAELGGRGVRTLEQLTAMSLEDLQSISGIGEKTVPRIRASAQAYLEDKPVWFGSIPEAICKQGAILDVRVDPDTLPEWPWGFCLSSPAQEKHYVIDMPGMPVPTRLHLPDGKVVGLVPHIHYAWAHVRDLAFEYHWMVYYWGKSILKHLNETAPHEVQKDLKPRMVDLHKIFVDAVVLPTKSTGLVDTATYLDYTNWPKDNKPFMSHLAYLHWRRDCLTPKPVIDNIPNNGSFDYFTSIYHSFVQQFESRNEALFRVGCMMRDEGYDFDTVKAILLKVHVQHPPVTRHKPETTFQRQREAHMTLRSVFKRPARPKSNHIAVKAHASYIPNHLREAILKHKYGTAFLRVYEGLRLVGKSAGARMTERDIHSILAPHSMGRRSIRNALTFTPDIDTLDEAIDSKMPKTVTNTCVFVPTTKRGKIQRIDHHRNISSRPSDDCLTYSTLKAKAQTPSHLKISSR